MVLAPPTKSPKAVRPVLKTKVLKCNRLTPTTVDSSTVLFLIQLLSTLIHEGESKVAQAMKSRIKLASTILVLMLAIGSLSRFLDWMNLPSDLWFWGGLVGLLLLLIVTQSIVAAIWLLRKGS
jgi:hypothetical protein